MITDHLDFEGAFIKSSQYLAMYKDSIENSEIFWKAQANRYLNWHRSWDQVMTGDFLHQNVRWFPGGELNASVNCVDRHLPEKENHPAIIWEGDELSQSRTLTYGELHRAVGRFANVLKEMQVKTGDRVCIYMPMIPEAVIAMLACARIGAIHSVVFAGFAPDSLKSRIQDAECVAVITADGSQRAGKILPLKENVDAIIQECPSVKQVLVVKYTGQPITMGKQDIWYHEWADRVSSDCPPVFMESTDPLFILYTSGSTGKPKGIVHSQAGYLLYAAMTFHLIFNYQKNDLYWCTADIGWITGHSYIVYGPLLNGATILLFAGIPTYPTPSRFWDIIDKHQVNILYTSPTALRALMRKGDEWVKKSNRKSLQCLASVGEPINPDVWLWFYEVVGEKRCPVIDTWWQTETGGIMIAPLPGATPLEPGSATLPFFGIVPEIVDNQGNVLKGKALGNLVISRPWPGQCQTIYKNEERYKQAYFSQFPGKYCPSDAAFRDEKGYYWMMGRTDDVLNVSGHRLDTAEIENVLVAHPKVNEAAVVGFPHDIKGEGIFAFVALNEGVVPDEALKEDLIQQVRKKISPIASPDHIEWVEDLPKTRSGKIMRRLLRKIVSKDTSDLGDLSTLTNPEALQKIIDTLNKNSSKRSVS